MILTLIWIFRGKKIDEGIKITLYYYVGILIKKSFHAAYKRLWVKKFSSRYFSPLLKIAPIK